MCTPYAMLAKLDDLPADAAPDLTLPDATKAEFRKTAEKLDKPPFNMSKASKYLKQLLGDVSFPKQGVPDTSWVQKPHRSGLVVLEGDAMRLDFDVEVPAAVWVGDKGSPNKSSWRCTQCCCSWLPRPPV